MSDVAPALLLVIVTLILPPLSVLMIAGCGPDLLLNLILTVLAYFPGAIHAFYLIYVYYDRRSQARRGSLTGSDAPLVFSDRIQSGGMSGYGTMDVYAAPEQYDAAGAVRPEGDPMRPGPEQMRSGTEPLGARAEPVGEKSVKI